MALCTRAARQSRGRCCWAGGQAERAASRHARSAPERGCCARAEAGVGKEHSGGHEVDLVLSSGFLAFAAHAGFLSAVEEHLAATGGRVGGVMGTSAGALAGSLYAAGYEPAQLASVLREKPPLAYLSLNTELWRGVFSLDGAVERLRELLPATFEELPTRFACGVVDARGRYRVVTSGPLPEAVAASAAVPCLFRAVSIPGLQGGPFQDGGKVDRVGLRPWRRLGAPPPSRTLCHVIDRSSPFSGDDDVKRAAAESGGGARVLLVRSPRSRQSLAGLEASTFEMQYAAARGRAMAALSLLPAEALSQLDAV